MKQNKSPLCIFNEWRAAVTDPTLRAELLAMESDARAIEDAFWREMAFGIGGLRGVMGVGTDRMNVYTVTRAAL